MRLSWRKLRRWACGAVVVLLATGIVAWFWPNAPYDIDRVHPVIRELREPFRDVWAGYYLDGGSVAVHVVDADGRDVALVFPVEEWEVDDGRVEVAYEKMFLGQISDPNRVEAPFTQDSMNRAIEIVDEFGVSYTPEGFERMVHLGAYRQYPRDFMRAAWIRLWCDVDG
jgi:hypothetical protein